MLRRHLAVHARRLGRKFGQVSRAKFRPVIIARIIVYHIFVADLNYLEQSTGLQLN